MKPATSIIAALALPASLLALQTFRDTPKPFREYPGWEYETSPSHPTLPIVLNGPSPASCIRR